jgi:gliding motility-associated protein GldC
MNTSEIKITVQTDENHVPDTLRWSASDAGIDNQEAKAMILSMWDKKTANALRIDLWNKDMQVDEMKQFVHQTMLTLADSFEKATGEDKMALAMRDFCEYFAEKMNLKRPL